MNNIVKRQFIKKVMDAFNNKEHPLGDLKDISYNIPIIRKKAEVEEITFDKDGKNDEEN